MDRLSKETAPSCLTASDSVIGLMQDLPWQKRRVPTGFWDSRANRLWYFTWLGQQCGFETLEDWYRLRKHHFNENGGGGLFRNRYTSSILQAMRDFRPDYDWKPWLFGGAPNGFWKSRKNRCEYMRWLGGQLGFQSCEDWYSVTTADFFSNHGGGLLNNHFGTSVQAVLADYIRDYDWKPWLFSSVPQNYWRSAIHRRHYLSWLGDQLGFSHPGDWCRLKREDFCTHGGSGLLSGYYRGSTTKARQEYFRTTAPPAVLDQRWQFEAPPR